LTRLVHPHKLTQNRSIVGNKAAFG